MHKILSLIKALTLCSTIAEAAPTAAIARHGSPKYDPSKDTHFKYRDPSAKKGGKIRIGTVGSFDSLNMFIVKGIAAEGLAYTTASLMRRSSDEPFSMYANLAESIDISEDGSKVTFKLNQSAKFHDGTPVTAEDVKFTMEVLRDKGWPRYKTFFGPKRIKEIVVLDDRTIQFDLLPNDKGKCDPELPLMISLMTVLSKKQLEGQDLASFSQTPLLAAGPYKVKSYDLGRSITYERIKDYWGEQLLSNKGGANFNEIEVIYVKNATAHFQEFLTGNIDIYFEQDVNQWNTRYDVPAVKKGKIKKLELTHSRPVPVRVIAFNMRRPNFEDLRVRQALSLAFDFDTLNKLVFYSSFKRAKSLFENTPLAHKGAMNEREKKLIAPFMNEIEKQIKEGQLPAEALEVGYTPATTKGDGDQRENLAQADKLLNEAGWAVKDGKRVNDKGEQLSFEFLLKDERLEKIALAFQRSLGFLGIDLKVRRVDNVQYETRTSNRDFDMIIHTWSNSLSPGDEQVYYFSRETANIQGSSNYIGIKDELVENLAKTLNETKAREDLEAAVHNLDRIVMHKCYMIPLGYENTSYIAYHADRIAFPPVDPAVGISIVDNGYSLQEEDASTFSGIVKWLRSLIFKS